MVNTQTNQKISSENNPFVSEKIKQIETTTFNKPRQSLENNPFASEKAKEEERRLFTGKSEAEFVRSEFTKRPGRKTSRNTKKSLPDTPLLKQSGVDLTLPTTPAVTRILETPRVETIVRASPFRQDVQGRTFFKGKQISQKESLRIQDQLSKNVPLSQIKAKGLEKETPLVRAREFVKTRSSQFREQTGIDIPAGFRIFAQTQIVGRAPRIAGALRGTAVGRTALSVIQGVGSAQFGRQTPEAISRLTLSPEERKIALKRSSQQALKSGFEAREREASKRISFDIPRPIASLKERKLVQRNIPLGGVFEQIPFLGQAIAPGSFESGVRTELKRQGFSGKELERRVKIVQRERVGREFGQIGATLAISTSSELIGQQLTGRSFQTAAKKGQSFVQQKGFKEVFKRVAPRTGIAGLFEGGLEAQISAQGRGRKATAKETVESAIFGGISAFTLGGFIPAARVTGKAAGRRASKTVEFFANIADPFEKPGDITASLIQTGKRKLGFPSIPTPTIKTVKTGRVTTLFPGVITSTSNTINGKTGKGKVSKTTTPPIITPSQIPAPAPTPTPTLIQQEILRRRVSPIPTPSPIPIFNFAPIQVTTPTETPSETPAETPVQVTTPTNIPIPIPTITPIIRTPFLPPVPFSLPVFGTFGGRGGKRGTKGFRELEAAKSLFSNLINVRNPNFQFSRSGKITPQRFRQQTNRFNVVPINPFLPSSLRNTRPFTQRASIRRSRNRMSSIRRGFSFNIPSFRLGR